MCSIYWLHNHNTQVDDAQKIDEVMPMYNLIEYNDAYLKTLGNGEIVDFPADENNSVYFKFKQQIKGETESNSEKKFKAMVPLSYLSTFWRTPEMPLIDCEISF